MTGSRSEGVGMLEPVLESLTGEMGAELGDKELAELRVLALTKDLPHVSVTERCVAGNLQFKKMVLVGVQVHCVHPTWALL
jgi:hypothetical protein